MLLFMCFVSSAKLVVHLTMNFVSCMPSILLSCHLMYDVYLVFLTTIIIAVRKLLSVMNYAKL